MAGEDSDQYWTGAFASGYMLLTILTSLYPIRKLMKRIWVWSHHIFPLAAVIAAILHGSAIPAIMTGVYVVDKLFGYIFQAQIHHGITKSQTVAHIDGNFIRLSFPRMTKSFRPGQYMFICVPKVSRFE